MVNMTCDGNKCYKTVWKEDAQYWVGLNNTAFCSEVCAGNPAPPEPSRFELMERLDKLELMLRALLRRGDGEC